MTTPPPPRRFAQTIRIKPGHLTEYIRIHNPIPDAIAAQIKRCNISDYSIFVDEGTSTLFATFKYGGADFERDMEAMRNDPATREWWATTDAMQESLNAGSKGSEDRVVSWWRGCREVFRLE